jgi:hypothetical protein
MKGFTKALNKFFNRKELVITVIVVLIAVALLSYSNTKSPRKYDNMTLQSGPRLPASSGSTSSYSAATSDLASQPSVLETSAQHVVPAPKASSSLETFGNTPADLLPSDANSQWASLNPTVGAATTPDLLQAGYHIGLDTIGQTLRNANLQLRSDPIIPKSDVGPWHNSTIEPDVARVPLEIGYGMR